MLSLVFTFAPLPLTTEESPLAVAAELAKRRQAEAILAGGVVRHRINPANKKTSEPGSLMAA
jgi:hypothetical protein